MNTIDEARALLNLAVRGPSWMVDWSALPDGLIAELLAGQPRRVFMSSGTTGEPKAVTRSADVLIRELDATVAVLDRDHDSVHATIEARTLYGYAGTFVGARLGLPTTFDRWGATGRPILGANPIVFMAPVSWRSLLASLEKWDGQAMTIVHAGSLLPPVLVEWARGRAPSSRITVLDLFGTTETGLLGARRAHPDHETNWAVATDTRLTFPSVDDVGEARPTVTSPRVVDPLRPGTVHLQLDDWLVPAGNRFFGFRGRRERIVKPGGRRVDLDRLEAEISSLLPTLDIACVPVRHHELGEDVQVIVVGDADLATEVLREMRRAPATSLSFIPRSVTAVTDIPRSPMGKVRRVVTLPNQESAA